MSVALSLGPLLFNWPAEMVRAFYRNIAAHVPVETVFLGETVCSKRSPLMADALSEAAEDLDRAGIEVIHTSLALATEQREVETIKSLAGSGLMVEANDMAALGLLQGRPHAVGPFVNVYSEATAAFLARRGATRICLPHELDLDAIAAIASATPARIEVLGFGRMPLALSARCYHARMHGLGKDNCRFVCGQDLDGADVATLDGQDFLAINGIETMSSSYACLLGDLHDLADAGVSSIRLSPHSCDMVEVAKLYRQVLDGASPVAAVATLAALAPSIHFSNGFLRGQAGNSRISVSA